MLNWDFQTALGDTIREKYENMYVKIVEISNVVNRKTLSEASWIVIEKEPASIFNAATADLFC
jgi:hypothetical protein